MSYFDDASLVMIPSGYKTSKVYSVKPTDGSGDLTFSRSNDTATRVNSAGLIEKVRTNLLTYSNTFSNAAWTKSNVTLISGQTDPNGGSTATNVDPTNTLSAFIRQNISITSGLKYTWSVYIKGSTTGQSIALYTDGASNIYEVKALTTSWQRFTGVATAASSGSSGFYILCGSGYSGLTDLPFDIAFGQVESSDIATDYIATTSAAVSVGPVANVPRLDYLGSSCGKLLLEPQRTNLVTYSEQFDNAAWDKANATITANTTVSPDGNSNADTLAVTSGGYVAQTITLNGTYVFSVFAKYTNTRWLFIEAFNQSDKGVWFDIQNGAVGSSSSGAIGVIENYGNGWYRCSVVLSLTNATTSFFAIFTTSADNSFTRQGGSFIWGAQIEAGAYATSYIPTLGAAVTRGADAAYKDSLSVFGTNVGSFFVDAEGPFFDGVNAGYLFDLSDNVNATTNRFALYSNGSSVLQLFTNTGTDFTASVTARKKIAVIWNGTNTKVYLNGAKVVDITYANANPTSINLNSRFNDTEYGNSKYNQVLAFPTALSDADAISLTTL